MGGGRYARIDKGAGVVILNSPAVQVLTRTYLDFVDRGLLRLEPASIAEIQRHKGAEVLDLVRRDDGWHSIRPANGRADEQVMSDLLNQLSDLRAIRIAAFPARDLKAFGLDTPEAIFTIRRKGDAKPVEHILKIGKIAPAANGDRFALVDAAATVGVLPGALASRLLAEPLAFRDRTLAKFADADKLRLERGTRHATFTRVNGTWKLTEPWTAEADQTELDEFLNSLAKLRADALVAEKPTAEQLKSFGLDKPEARWHVLAGDKELYQLVIGTREKNGPRIYARLADRDLLFLLDAKLSAKVLAEFRTRSIWNPAPDASQVVSLRFGFARNPFALEKDGDTWKAAGKPDAHVNKEKVSETLAAIGALKLSRYVLDKDADLKLFGLEPPELTLEIGTPSGKKVLHIGRTEGDSKRRYARSTEGAH
ncbi:MAG: DUF4340 domain-containing protein, partial [Candidatus Acidiferrum sp.]